MCGIFGIYDPVGAPDRDVARLTYFGLYALQHRGQESAGIAVSDGSRVMAMKDMGLVNQVFDEPKLSALPGRMAIATRATRPPARPCGATPSRSCSTPAAGRSRSPTTAT